MGCGCNNEDGAYRVRMPNGEIKVYSSSIAATARVNNTPGAVLLSPDTKLAPSASV